MGDEHKREHAHGAGVAAAERYHAVDALRALAMFLGVVLHGALGFMVQTNAFTPRMDRSRWLGFDLGVYLIHSFRMQLFFVVAGIFTALLLGKRGAGAFAIGRLKRIGLPLVAGAMIIVPLTRLPFFLPHMERLGRTEVLKGLFAGPAHLWFLEYLLVFSAAAWAASLLWGKSARGRRMLETLGVWASAWWGIGAMLPATVLLTLAQGWWIVTTPVGWIPDAGTLAYYGWFFLVGCAVQSVGASGSEERGVLRMGRGWKWIVPVSVVALAPALVAMSRWLPVPPTGVWSAAMWGRVATAATVHGLFTWGMIHGLFGVFGAACGAGRGWVRWLADSSYWVYLLHLPLIYWGQYLMAGWDVPGMGRGIGEALVTFAILVVGATAVCLGTYAVIVRRTWLEEIVGGGRRRA